MQLRDEKPSIVYPGNWGLFGGSIENGESVCEAASRELKEEIESTKKIFSKLNKELSASIRKQIIN